ncbi:MAG: pyridoxamine 5'-phosphate oxidase family protein [Campylobacteraceae bacterium]|jgi:nitroimidazol reductase NimA-like FMN-containing flavoprotein (pyridoxamine 5'-phosphate oxidase superfamily)|nr:pyridoxamine 5'-phosphate oxidase family protein [Campylobacteraceae bacterium]
MRRAEFDIKDETELVKFLHEASFGTLCINDKPYPYAVGVNFIFHDKCIYFHGAMNGRKYSLACKNPHASFSAVKEYAFIPSYFFSGFACGASQYFISVFLEGELRIMEDKTQKAAALELLMKKYQNEGKYEHLHAYDKMLDKTAVFQFQIASSSLKIKAGQNLSKDSAVLLIEKLKKRDAPKDKETIELIKKFALKNKN